MAERAKKLHNVGGEGMEGFGLWFVGLFFRFFLSFFFKAKAPILCHHFYGICNSGKNLSLI